MALERAAADADFHLLLYARGVAALCDEARRFDPWGFVARFFAGFHFTFF